MDSLDVIVERTSARRVEFTLLTVVPEQKVRDDWTQNISRDDWTQNISRDDWTQNLAGMTEHRI